MVRRIFMKNKRILTLKEKMKMEKFASTKIHQPLSPLKYEKFYFWRKTFEIVSEIILGLVNDNKEPLEKVLDVGCAEGLTGIKLIEKGLCKYYIGLDIASGLLKKLVILKHNNDGLNYKIDAVNADAQYLPFKCSSFSISICIDLLEHVPDPALMLEEIFHVSSQAILIVPLEGEWPPLGINWFLKKFEPHRRMSFTLITYNWLLHILHHYNLRILKVVRYDASPLLPIGFLYSHLPFFRKRISFLEKLDEKLCQLLHKSHHIALLIKRN